MACTFVLYLTLIVFSLKMSFLDQKHDISIFSYLFEDLMESPLSSYQKINFSAKKAFPQGCYPH